MDTEYALELFLRGELGVPSVENRSERRTAHGLTILHTDAAWNGERHIADEVIVRHEAPAPVLAAVAAYCPVPDYRMPLLDRPASDHDAYLAAGYHHTATETVLVRPLTDLPPPDECYPVEQATTRTQLAWLNAHDPAGKAWLTETQLHEPRLRHAFIVLDQQPVARVRVCRIDAAHSYGTNLYTAAAYRRRGLAQALMTQVLHWAARDGGEWSVLVSSAAGLALYQGLGYQPCAQLVIFEPDPTQTPDRPAAAAEGTPT